MCKGSLVAKNVIEAQKGARYQIGISSHGLPAFHPQGMKTEDCIACVKNGETLTLLGIPVALQQKHQIGATEKVTFIDTGDNTADKVRLWKTGKHIDLREFTDSVTAYVGEILELDESDDHELLRAIGHGEVMQAGAYAGA